MSKKSQYNQTFEKLVKDSNDYIGMVAYCLYKKELSKHLDQGKSKQSFLEVNDSIQARKRYRSEANGLLTNFIEISIDEHIDKIKEPLTQQILEISRETLETSTDWERFKRWHKSGLAGFVPTFWKGIAIGILLIVLSFNETWTKLLETFQNYLTNL
ncbi:TPA: hypothetical protein KDZ67_004621 [Vibrio parahaemolyticus]|nr:hypothetical protein [Vibrio parahaemolyticus]